MNIFIRFKQWLTLQKATRIYLWWVVIRWFLRWGATGIFLVWIWFLATDAKKEDFQKQLKFKVTPPIVVWSTEPMMFATTNDIQNIVFGLKEDGSVVWKDYEEID